MGWWPDVSKVTFKLLALLAFGGLPLLVGSLVSGGAAEVCQGNCVARGAPFSRPLGAKTHRPPFVTSSGGCRSLLAPVVGSLLAHNRWRPLARPSPPFPWVWKGALQDGAGGQTGRLERSEGVWRTGGASRGLWAAGKSCAKGLAPFGGECTCPGPRGAGGWGRRHIGGS